MPAPVHFTETRNSLKAPKAQPSVSFVVIELPGRRAAGYKLKLLWNSLNTYLRNQGSLCIRAADFPFL